jgi:hypothetical protein
MVTPVVRWPKFRLPYVPVQYHGRIYSILAWLVLAAFWIWLASVLLSK